MFDLQHIDQPRIWPSWSTRFIALRARFAALEQSGGGLAFRIHAKHLIENYLWGVLSTSTCGGGPIVGPDEFFERTQSRGRLCGVQHCLEAVHSVHPQG